VIRNTGAERWLDEPEPGVDATGVVDAHVHVFPPRVFEAIWSWFDRHAWPIRYRLPADEVAEWLAARGVGRAWALHYSHKPGMARALNHFVREVADRHPLLVPFGTVLPGEPGERDVVREALDDLGLAGLKLHCHVQKLGPDDPRLFPVYEMLAERGKPLVLHAGREPASDAYGFDCHGLCGAEPVRRVVRRYPALKLVVPHLGQDQWREFLELCREAPNLYLDTTMAIGGFLSDDRPGAEDLLPLADRILFGTDFPNLPYAWGRELGVLRGLGLPPEALQAILGGNALRLVGATTGTAPPRRA
jgi:predicted TIM-barrel fold metal-dependent hydrolase